MKVYIILILLFTAISVHAQWPGAYFTFQLKDKDGFITADNDNYKIFLDKSTVVGPSSISMCKDKKMWRFYKGDKDLYQSNVIKIVKMNDSDTMSVEIPSSKAKVKDGEYYANFYIGNLKFKKGLFVMSLPKTDSEWEEVTNKEIEMCTETYGYNKYFDISKFQKK